MTKQIPFEDALEDDDWGLIISSTGELKGLFIPEGKEEEDVPQTIVEMCTKIFSIDVTQDYQENTIH